jgi:uncharacterized protein
MIAIDTNVLVYAHVPSFTQHPLARRALERLANSGSAWAVPWPCAHEFCAVVTNRKWRADALDAAAAIAILRNWESAPNFRFLGASVHHLNHFSQTLLLSKVTGGQIHDARIVATCLDHNVTELWSADRDFSRFPGIRTRNPLKE